MDMQNNGLSVHPDSHVDSSITIVQESENLRASPGNSDLKSIIQIDNVDEEKNVGNSTTASLSDTTPDKGADEISEGRSNPGWLSVIAVFLVNFCVFGVVFSWGIIQNVYLTEVYVGKTDQFSIAFVGTIAGSLIVCAGIIVTPLAQLIGNRQTMLIGAVLAPAGLIFASFANELWQIYLSEGLLFGIGGSLAWASSVSLPAQWFNKNRALASEFGATIGVNASQVSVILGIMAACNAVSRILLGFLADRFGRINATFLVTFLAGFFMMVVWIQVKSLGTLYAFGVLYGLTGGGFISLFPAVTAELVPVEKIQQGVSLAFFSMALGSLFGTPIGSLLQERVGFTAAIEFSGATTVTSSMILLYLRQRRSHGKIFCKV
ncbi:unnamed protein product [Umbelopsis vinacea]